MSSTWSPDGREAKRPGYPANLYDSDSEYESDGDDIKVEVEYDMEGIEEEYMEDPHDFLDMEIDPTGDDPLAVGYAHAEGRPNQTVIITVPFDAEAEGFYEDEFVTPDAHELYANIDIKCERQERLCDNEENAPKEGVEYVKDQMGEIKGLCIRGRGQRLGRGSRRSGRGGGPGNRGTFRELRGAPTTTAHSWTHGDRLKEVCVDDADVPPLLRTLAQDLVRSRAANHAKHQEMREQQRLKDSENMPEIKSERLEVDVEFEEAENALLEERADYFEWLPMETFQGTKEAFLPEKTGSVKECDTMYDAFRTYWDDDILEHIATETNRYASSIKSQAFQKDWCPTNIHEILVLFSFWIMLGVIKMPTIRSCFSMDLLLKTKAFRTMFSYRRYSLLRRALHFANNDVRPPDASRLYLLDPIIDHLNAKFQANYIPKQNIRINESLMLWNGLMLFKQFIASKVTRFGIKTFELCESATGYLWSFKAYTEQDPTNDNPMLKSTSLVTELMQPLLGKGYTLFMDSWFNSPMLARFLKRNKTDCVGTLRSTQCGIPPSVSSAELLDGEVMARHSGDVAVIAWQQRKRMMMISTCHGSDVTQVRTGRVKRLWKPTVVLDYNKNMGGVDRKDQMLEPYLIDTKHPLKWYMKLFKRLLNTSILNARILGESSTEEKVDHLTSRLSLVDSILEKHLALVPARRTRLGSENYDAPSNVAHWPARIPRDPNARSTNHPRRRCTRCFSSGRKDIKSMYKCEQCDLPLCIECFKDFHVRR